MFSPNTIFYFSNKTSYMFRLKYRRNQAGSKRDLTEHQIFEQISTSQCGTTENDVTNTRRASHSVPYFCLWNSTKIYYSLPLYTQCPSSVVLNFIQSFSFTNFMNVFPKTVYFISIIQNFIVMFEIWNPRSCECFLAVFVISLMMAIF